MKNKFSEDVKVIEVLDSHGYSCGVIRRAKFQESYHYYARSPEQEVEAFFETEAGARRYLLSKTAGWNDDFLRDNL